MKIDIKDYKIIPFKDSNFIKPQRANYQINGVLMNWDFIKTHDCVSIFLYHEDLNSYVFVKQFRPPLYFHQGMKDLDDGFSVELCSGLIDKNKSKEQIAKEECIEELGICPKKLEFIGEFYTGFGIGVNAQFLYFASIDDSDYVSSGGGVDLGEFINPVYVKVDEFDEFFNKHKRSSMIDFMHLWFLKNKLF